MLRVAAPTRARWRGKAATRTLQALAATRSACRHYHHASGGRNGLPSCWVPAAMLAVAASASTIVGTCDGQAGVEPQSGDESEEEETEQSVVPGLFRGDLPTVSLDELQSHDGAGPDASVWVAYGRGVYDVTEFARGAHPGGDKILLAAGGDIAPFWDLYAVHKTGWVYEVLEELRIANLDSLGAQKLEAAAQARAAAAAAGGGMFAHEPPRLPTLEVRSQRPFNAETPPSALCAAFRTPSDEFYVRNHLAVPRVDAASHVLTVEGRGIRAPVTFTLDDLATKFEQVDVEVTLQCGGNRRREMSRVRNVHGLDWDRAAIGNAVWRGPRLRDVLRAAGLPLDEDAIVPVQNAPVAPHEPEGGPAAANAAAAGMVPGEAGGAAARRLRDLHVQMEGADTDEGGSPYGASVPAWRAVSAEQDVVLALKMNGGPMPRDHGFPLRAVVPGVVGSRSVKWLTRIRVADEESASFWQRKDYKALGPATDWSNPDLEHARSIQEMPVQAAVLLPLPRAGADEAVVDGSRPVTVEGYAWSGGGRGIARVDVSADGGATWQEAELRDESGQRDGRHWAWVLWKTHVAIPAGATSTELVARAVDSSLNVQPERVGPQWSARGLLNNAWTRVPLRVRRADEHPARAGAVASEGQPQSQEGRS